jgi:hypothetical protein
VRAVALRRPEHPERVAVVAAVLLVVVNVAIFGTRHEVRGTASQALPAAVLQISPRDGEHVIPQTSIVVDLRAKYTGQLSIDRVLIPQDQLTITTPNLFELVFQPTPAHDIHRYSPGDHTATIEFWPQTTTYEQARSGRLLGTYTWRFKVG